MITTPNGPVRLAIFDAPLDSTAEEIAAMAERYSRRDDLARDIR